MLIVNSFLCCVLFFLFILNGFENSNHFIFKLDVSKGNRFVYTSKKSVDVSISTCPRGWQIVNNFYLLGQNFFNAIRNTTVIFRICSSTQVRFQKCSRLGLLFFYFLFFRWWFVFFVIITFFINMIVIFLWLMLALFLF